MNQPDTLTLADEGNKADRELLKLYGIPLAETDPVGYSLAVKALTESLGDLRGSLHVLTSRSFVVDGVEYSLVLSKRRKL